MCNLLAYGYIALRLRKNSRHLVVIGGLQHRQENATGHILQPDTWKMIFDPYPERLLGTSSSGCVPTLN